MNKKNYTEVEQRNICRLKNFFEEVFNQRRRSPIYELFAPECINHYEHEDYVGPQEWEEKFLNPFLEAIPDVQTNVVDCTADGDIVVVRWQAEGVFEKHLFGVPPSGNIFQYSGISWVQIKNGMSVESWNNWNMSFLFRQLLTEVKTLREIIPICSFCKRIRDEKGYWEQVETYLSEFAQVGVSHSLCHECLKKEYPEIYEEMLMQQGKQ